MLLSVALFTLFMTGFWLYCLTDAILTPASEFPGMPKPAWIAVIAVTFIGGAIAWLVVRQPARSSSAPLAPMPHWDPGRPAGLGDDYFQTARWTGADDAVARHPAGRAGVAGRGGRPAGRGRPDGRGRRAKGPDDDAEFLRALDRAIHGNSQAGEEV